MLGSMRRFVVSISKNVRSFILFPDTPYLIPIWFLVSGNRSTTVDLVQLGKEIVIEDGKVTDIGMMFITFVFFLSVRACVCICTRILVILIAYCFSLDESCMLKLNQFNDINRGIVYSVLLLFNPRSKERNTRTLSLLIRY